MALSTRETFSLITVTLLAIFMIVSGSALLFKSFAPHRFIMARSLTFDKILSFLEYAAIFIFVPGTVSLYSAYIKTLFK
ncbi:hypothetical protein [Lumpy skin disease virus]|uniref:IMV membrane protein n=3 Tax=Capripoxvirus TaxID=10265 RepID=A0A3F2YKK2_SHEVT|nr:putative IMV membrane protein [Lumpy skin disease virus NI-2490]NP_659618.1 putative IMV membrane protein [Sheeppox virus]AAN02614.1 hypothetical protein [Lumpy skin disease virus NW-LW]AOE47622.1 putative IMV membrane protein [Lumpy skin disease virus]AAK85007.1 LSDV046 hypothetical protein [Lumpy skin disease virus NI-2490]AOE46407.1 IMV membrane protein [Sheeppox virus]AOE46556.1 IMV membrane protein [Sheeppox virus]